LYNRFEIIFDEIQDGKNITNLYNNTENCLEGLEALSEEEEGIESDE